MASCLGIYVEPNIIKYAKVSRDHDNILVESFGIKFYDRLGDAIKQVISDTYSFKVPICINLSEESYQYFYMFSLLNKKDLKKAISTEFEAECAEKNINKNAYETRYALVNSLDDKEKVKVINVSSNKNSINTMAQHYIEYNLSAIAPIGISISNIANLQPKENVLIVNMEKETTLTTIVDQKIYSVEKIEEGAQTVLDNINLKENSYSKAYEICKNTTIYTMEGRELQDEENEHLEDIMPTLYQIATKVQEILNNGTIKINRIYISGTLSAINNIDLYFQEFFSTERCEILKPFFIKDTIKINMKDYVEVNSAIALGMQGLGFGLKDMNFKERDWKDDLNTIFSSFSKNDDSQGGGSNIKSLFGNISFDLGLGGKIDKIEAWLLRMLGGITLLIIIYCGFSIFLKTGIEEKSLEVAEVTKHAQMQISAVDADKSKVETKKAEYEQLTENLNNVRQQFEENNKNKKAIPILLTQIMSTIPQGVQLTSIENTTGSHIIITAQSSQYEQLGYFKAILRTQGILAPASVVSSAAVKSGSLITITIEGDLP